MPIKWRKAWKQHAKRALGLTRVAELPSTRVIWTGFSPYDGAPIMAVVQCGREESRNVKTGDMMQIAIMRRDIAPGPAYAAGKDTSCCPEDCIHRSEARGGLNTCYVDKHRLYAAWGAAVEIVEAGDVGVPDGYFKGVRVRFGNEGDPAAVPFEVWKPIADEADAFTGYTADWRNLGPEWRELFMASVSSPADAMRARAAGWRFFASSGRESDDAAFAELGRECNATAHGVSCVACLGCDGTGRGERRPSWWLPFHGATGAVHRRRAE